MACDKPKILILCTGGTIDKNYPRGSQVRDFEIGKPVIHRILRMAAPDFEYVVKSVIKKDSLDMGDGDREIICNFCRSSGYRLILVTHGTDTMIDTAECLSKLKDKTIVLTGSSFPGRFKDTDADFNIGAAIGFLSNHYQDDIYGVYIAMNARIRDWDKVMKDESGMFVDKHYSDL